MSESEKTNKTKRNVFSCIILIAIVSVLVICIKYIVQRNKQHGNSVENSVAFVTEYGSEAESAGETGSAAGMLEDLEGSEIPEESEIPDGMTVKHLSDVDIVYPDNYFDNSVISQPDEDVTCITLKGSNEISVLYVAELSDDMLLSGFPDYILNQYADIINDTYGTNDYSDYEWNSVQMRRYELSDHKTAFVCTGSSYALYMEIVTDGTAGAVEQALSYIQQK